MTARVPHVVVGIGGQLGHDSNAACFVDGKLIASSQEERYSRKKHDGGFPTRAALDCLRIAGVEPGDVEACVFAEKAFQSLFFERTGRQGGTIARMLSRMVPGGAFPFREEAQGLFPNAGFHHAWHHLSHAAAALYTSPFERAAFLCVDGKGEDSSATIGIASRSGFQILEELPFENGIGLLYTAVTEYLGFASMGSEYKVMGLAPYGTPRLLDMLRRLLVNDPNGASRLVHPWQFRWASMQQTLRSLADHFGEPVRTGGELTSFHIDLAASLQVLFEEEVLRMARHAHEITAERALLFCGGCAQNCVAAGILRRSGPFDDVFNSPVGGDMGTAFGAGLLYLQQQNAVHEVDARGFLLGSEPGPVPGEALDFRVDYEGDIHAATARLLAQGHVVGWVRGRMELGARALGARSILADPRVPHMQSTLNLKVKFRESFRPFAPAVLAEDCAEWFETSARSDFMQYTEYLREDRRRPEPPGLAGPRARLDFERCEIPSVTHVDFSARLQTVQADTHPDFHRLIRAFKRESGVPIVINTSFNVSGQPIVRTAQEAWECFRHTDIDYLVVNDHIFRNPADKTREEKMEWLRQFARFA